MIFRLLALCVVVVANVQATAFAQDRAGETFAAYALDFCAAVVDGAEPRSAAATASPTARLIGPQPANDDAEVFGRLLEADRDTPLIILGPPNSQDTVMAFARADQTRCLAFVASGADGFQAAVRQTDIAGSLWQREAEAPNGGLIFHRNAQSGVGSIVMLLRPGAANETDQVIVERSPRRTPILNDDQRAAWAAHVIAHCVGAVHQRQPLSVEELAPYFVREEPQTTDALSLTGAEGQPSGVLFVNAGSGSACLATISSGGVPSLTRAVMEALDARGAALVRGDREGMGAKVYRLNKPRGARGRDALILVDRSSGLLVLRVFEL